MPMPNAARYVLERLRSAGYEAYLVGGCVRDMLMGRVPHDWDVCTSARPEQMQAVFTAERTIEAGLKHGTLGILYDGEVIEATSYRAEGAYSDCRHPDFVRFVTDIRADLARRDFTINAMAWDGEADVIDPFGGAADLDRRLIRCVGEAAQRFDEDALRMLRALRFAARFGFAVEAETAVAIHAQYQALRAVSAERVWEEIKGIVMGEHAASVLREFADVVEFILPGAKAFADGTPVELSIRLALLLRESDASALDGLRCERALRREVELLLQAEPPVDELSLWRLGLRYGLSPAGKIARLYGWPEDAVNRAMGRCPCPGLHDLAVSGRDLTALGFAGTAVGAALDALADGVLCGAWPNERTALLQTAEEMNKYLTN